MTKDEFTTIMADKPLDTLPNGIQILCIYVTDGDHPEFVYAHIVFNEYIDEGDPTKAQDNAEERQFIRDGAIEDMWRLIVDKYPDTLDDVARVTVSQKPRIIL